MLNLLEIDLKLDKEIKNIYFGIPDNKKELDEMYKLRYRVYLNHNYINENKAGLESDEYDDGRSTYFIAKIDNRIIGTVRLIKDYYLPTEKDCFAFQEPEKILSISRDNRAELGRLIVEKYKENKYLPRNLILLGLIMSAVSYARENDLFGGYAFIKDSLKIKLEKLKFPFHSIEPFSSKYDDGVLKKYFSDANNQVCPIYYVTEEVYGYIARIFNNKMLFRKIEKKQYFLRNNTLFKLLRFFNAL